ncbi:flagellar basal body-associated protein FliL [Sulfurimonas aquatica]|uniref:Flagellar protein FliL n=1 Tax=Sulfurimonas aquatica TaxID=2672570 RepID=A0A975B0X7_9BACT|nr:flagellar basal body-associated protein FliL [Sulfurimonas aquatica]QSZ42115.1 flagellar basal body-associated protein FliL [Sulfurimonas aquatica]
MAEEETTEESAAPAEKKSNMLMIIIIVVLFLIIIIGAVVGFLLMGDDAEPVDNTPQKKERSAPKKRVMNSSTDSYDDMRQLSDIGILYPLDTFTVNLKSDAGRRYLKVTLSLELEGEELSLELDAKSPVLRDRIIRILTSKTLEEISSKKGKQKVSQQIMDTLNAMIKDGTIQGIYFTEFVIQ